MVSRPSNRISEAARWAGDLTSTVATGMLSVVVEPSLNGGHDLFVLECSSFVLIAQYIHCAHHI